MANQKTKKPKNNSNSLHWIWFSSQIHKLNLWHLFAVYNHVMLGAKDCSKRKLLRQEALAEGEHRCCICNIAWTIGMLPSHLLYFPSVGKALPHICTASKADRDIFFFPFLKWRKPKTKASLRTQRAILKWKTKMGNGVSCWNVIWMIACLRKEVCLVSYWESPAGLIVIRK